MMDKCFQRAQPLFTFRSSLVYQFLVVIMPGLSQRSPSSFAPEVGWGAQLDQGDEGSQPVAQGGVVDCRQAVLILSSFVRACSGQEQDC